AVAEAAVQAVDDASRIEVGALHHEGVALPPADGIAHPAGHFGRGVHAVDHAHDPHVVVHLDLDGDEVLGLDDLVVGVEAGVHHRRALGRADGDHAALGDRARFRVVVGRFAARIGLLPGVGEGDLAVGGLDDPRRARLAVD